MKTTDFVDAVHELRRELAPRRFDRGAIDLVVECSVHLSGFRRETQAAVHQVAHLAGAQVRGHDDDALRQIHAAVVAQRQRGLVQNAEQQLPERVGRLLDFVEQQDRELQLVGVPLVQRFLREQRMSLAMSQVSRRRTDQLGDFVGVLKLSAIDLDAGAGIAEQSFGHGLDHPRFARAGRPQKQQVAYRTSRRIQSGQKHLVDLGHFFDGLVLTDDLAAKGVVKLPGIVAAAGRIEHGVEDGFHRVVALLSFPGPFAASWETRCFRCLEPEGDKFCHPLSPRPLSDYCKRLAILGDSSSRTAFLQS